MRDKGNKPMSQRITVRLFDEELIKLKEQAKANNITVAQYVRNKVLKDSL